MYQLHLPGFESICCRKRPSTAFFNRCGQRKLQRKPRAASGTAARAIEEYTNLIWTWLWSWMIFDCVLKCGKTKKTHSPQQKKHQLAAATARRASWRPWKKTFLFCHPMPSYAAAPEISRRFAATNRQLKPKVHPLVCKPASGQNMKRVNYMKTLHPAR